MPIDEADVKVIVQDYMEDKVVFRANCIGRHEALDKARDERGKEVEKLGSAIKDLTTCINGKFNKIYLSVIGTLTTTLITLLALILTWLLRK